MCSSDLVGALVRLGQAQPRPAPIPSAVPTQPNVQPPTPVDRHVTTLPTADLINSISNNDLADVFGVEAEMTHGGIYSHDELQNMIGLIREYAMGSWSNFSDGQRELLARYLEDYLRQNPGNPPERRGPFQPGGASAVRGVPLGNLNIRPSITAEALRGPDRQPVRNFLQQVKNMPGVTKEGLSTGLMAFERMDPSRQMTKAEFARELLPSSYDIVDLKGAAPVNRYAMDMIENEIQNDPDASRQVFEDMTGLTDIALEEITNYLDENPDNHFQWDMLSDKAKKSFERFEEIGRAHV